MLATLLLPALLLWLGQEFFDFPPSLRISTSLTTSSTTLRLTLPVGILVRSSLLLPRMVPHDYPQSSQYSRILPHTTFGSHPSSLGCWSCPPQAGIGSFFGLRDGWGSSGHYNYYSRSCSIVLLHRIKSLILLPALCLTLS